MTRAEYKSCATAVWSGLALSVLIASAAAAPPEGIGRPFADIAGDQPGCALVTVQNGMRDFAGGFGRADVEKARAMTPDTLMEAASLSKQLTAFAILTLEAKGVLSTKDSVRRFVPELGSYTQPITIGDLIYHRSGLRDVLAIQLMEDKTPGADETWTYPRILGMLERQKGLDGIPGQQEFYNNTGYGVLALIAERASGQTLQNLLTDILFKPLGMSATTIAGADPARDADLAASYAKTPAGFKPFPKTPPFMGASAVRTTANDMALWVENFWTGKAGGRAVMAKMALVPQLPGGKRTNQAAGLVRTSYRGSLRLEHGGSVEGFRNRLMVHPREKFGLVMMCNRSDAALSARVDAVTDLYIGDKVGPPESKSFKVEDLAAPANLPLAKVKTGLYRDRADGEYIRLKRDGEATLIEFRGDALALSEIAPNIFRSKDHSSFPGIGIYVAFRGDEMIMATGGDIDHYQSVEEWKPTDLAPWAGTYWSDETRGHLTLELRDGALVAKLGPALFPLTPGRKGELIFRRGALIVPVDAPADHFTIEVGGARGIIYAREAR
jgi:CubicO group peptidase (beta-lactamase class C family)